MKKRPLVLGILVAALVSLGIGGGKAAALPPQTDVTGVITENSMNVASAQVTVVCNGSSMTDTTDAYGAYLVTYPLDDCPVGATLQVTAVKDGKSGATSGSVTGITTKLNLAIVNVSIPEYGLIGTMAAGVAGVGLIFYARRQQQQQRQV